jgi:hypothetical protein
MQKCKTLGEDTYFLFSYTTNQLILIYGFTMANQHFVILDDVFIKIIIQRKNDLSVNLPNNVRMSSYYTSTHWDTCPNTQWSPYVAKLLLDVFPSEEIDRIITI